LRTLTRRYLEAYARAAGSPFPQDPQVQLVGAIGAVFASWQSPKAREYRRQRNIPDTIGTAVTVQTMVYGNAGGRSGSGVGFTRDPVGGEPKLWIDFLFNAQGEDVVSGRRSASGHDELAAVMPAVWQALGETAAKLEQEFGDMQDFEFTVQDSHLYLLQTRSGKCSAQALARIALDLFDAGVISADVACERTAALKFDELVTTRTVSSDGQPLTPLARAASASSGVAVGEIAFDEAAAQARHAAGASVILVRRDAETADIAALELATGLLTQRGARTSHAAVVARQLGKVCLVGCSSMQLDETGRTLQIGKTTLREGDLLTLDGNDGAVYAGAVHTAVEPLVDLQARLTHLRAVQAKVAKVHTDKKPAKSLAS
jgi:pyruvate, orthophosphate dikinase